jgi:hypothetical protein
MIGHIVLNLSSQFVVLGLLALIAILLAWIVYLEIRLRRVFRGKQIDSFENLIADIGQALDDLFKKSESHVARLTILEDKTKQTLSRFHTVRFNPFKDQGGNQSFATCLLDEEGRGVVISSLYARDKVAIYAKPIENLISEYELTEEEKEAIKIASLKRR